MSTDEKVVYRKTKGPACSGTRMTSITRIKGTPGTTTVRQNQRMSLSAGPVLGTGSFLDTSSANVSGILQTRQKEKMDFRHLNSRLAQYIDNARVLETQNQVLAQQCEHERKKKAFDVDGLKDLYKQEMDAMKECIDELTKEKAEFASKIARLEDELSDEIEKNAKLEAYIKEDAKKLERELNKNGEYKTDLEIIRNQLAMKDDELARKDEKIKALMCELADQRTNLQEETEKRIYAEMKEVGCCEELEFKISCLEAEIAEYKKMLENDGGVIDVQKTVEGGLRAAIKQLQEDADATLAQQRADMQARFEKQMSAIQTGTNRDNMEIMKLQTEITKLKTRLSEDGPKLAELKAELDKLKAIRSELEMNLNMEKEDHDHTRMKLEDKIRELNEKLAQLSMELAEVTDDKCNLEMEISCYEKLLDGEDQYMRQLLDEKTGARSSGANQFADMIQSSGFDEMMSQQMMMGGGDMENSLSLTDTKFLVKRTCKGKIQFEKAELDGSVVTICNNDTKPASLKGYTVKRIIGGKEVAKFPFGDDVMLDGGHKVKIYPKKYKEKAAADDDKTAKHLFMEDYPTWGSSVSGCYSLTDNRGSEKACMTLEAKM